MCVSLDGQLVLEWWHKTNLLKMIFQIIGEIMVNANAFSLRGLPLILAAAEINYAKDNVLDETYIRGSFHHAQIYIYIFAYISPKAKIWRNRKRASERPSKYIVWRKLWQNNQIYGYCRRELKRQNEIEISSVRDKEWMQENRRLFLLHLQFITLLPLTKLQFISLNEIVSNPFYLIHHGASLSHFLRFFSLCLALPFTRMHAHKQIHTFSALLLLSGLKKVLGWWNGGFTSCSPKWCWTFLSYSFLLRLSLSFQWFFILLVILFFTVFLLVILRAFVFVCVYMSIDHRAATCQKKQQTKK